MEYVICGICCILFFLFGQVTGRKSADREPPRAPEYPMPDDLLSHDIMTLLNYAVPQRKENQDEQTD